MNFGMFCIIVVEEYFKKYLIICEYLKLNPALLYANEEVDKRCEALLANIEIENKKRKKLTKDLKWFSKKYQLLANGGWNGYAFVKRAKKLVDKEYIKLAPETISDELTVFELTRKNYDLLAERQKKAGFIVLAVFLSLMVITGIVLLSFML